MSGVRRTDKRVAIVGAGPAGLGCADILVRNGVKPVVFDRYAAHRRTADLRHPAVQAREAGGRDAPRAHGRHGRGVSARRRGRRAICRSSSCCANTTRCSSAWAPISYVKGGFPGEDLPGVYEALPYLIANINRELGLPGAEERFIDLKGKRVVVLGGGDTGMDCNRTAIRQGARVGDLHLSARRAATCPARAATTRTARKRASSSCSIASRSRSSARSRVEGVKVVQTRLGPPGPRGRRLTENVPGIRADHSGRCGDRRVRLSAESAELVRAAQIALHPGGRVRVTSVARAAVPDHQSEGVRRRGHGARLGPGGDRGIRRPRGRARHPDYLEL